jgi:hypothetical protein
VTESGKGNDTIFATFSGNIDSLPRTANIQVVVQQHPQTSKSVTVSQSRSGTGIENIETDSFKIFPNPSSDQITIEIKAPSQNNFITIISMTGKVMLERTFPGPKTIVNIENLPSGVYFIRLRNEKTVVVGKLIKE